MAITVKEFIEYLQRFPMDSEVSIAVIDATQRQKLAFEKRDLFMITDEDTPAILINIDSRNTWDVTDYSTVRP